MQMLVSKRALLATATSLVIGLSTAAIAQTPPAKGNAKSQEATTVGEGEAIMLHPKGTVHKSRVKVTAAQHEAALKKGAREVKPGAVIYRQGGKLYMMEDSANEKASSNFQSNFDVDY
jgi:FlaG/FlaF family flagellin (archaellin)